VKVPVGAEAVRRTKGLFREHLPARLGWRLRCRPIPDLRSRLAGFQSPSGRTARGTWRVRARGRSRGVHAVEASRQRTRVRRTKANGFSGTSMIASQSVADVALETGVLFREA
jgi:hypothetical protein